MSDIFDDLVGDFRKSLASTDKAPAAPGYSLRGTDSSRGGYDVSPPPPAPERSMFGLANDTMINTANSAVGLVKSGVDLFAPDSAISKNLGDFIQFGKDSQSDKQKGMDAQLSQSLSAAGEHDGTDMGRITAEAKKAGIYLAHGFTVDPAKTIGEIVGNIGPFAALGGAMQAARLSAPAAEILTGGISAGLGMGEVRGNIWEKIGNVKDADLQAKSPEYAQLRKTMSEAEAKSEIGANISRNFPELASIGLVSALTGRYGVEGMAAGIAPNKGRLASMAIGGADEGIIQGGGEQLASNYGVKRAIPSQSLSEDVGMNMAAEGLPGVAMGSLHGGGQAHIELPKPANPLQPVLDQADKPGSVLSRAALAAGAAGQAAVAPAAPTPDSAGQTLPQEVAPPAMEMGNTANPTGPGPSSDPYFQKAAQLEDVIRSQDLVRSIRQDGAGLNGVMFDLRTMRDPNAREDIKNAARQRVEEEITWAQTNRTPKPAMDTVAATPGFEPATGSPREPANKELPNLDGVIAAMQDPNIGPKIGDFDRQEILRLTGDANNKALPLQTRQASAQQAIDLVGRYSAGLNSQPAQVGQQIPALLGQAVPDQAQISSPEEQQKVASATVSNPSADPTSVPAVNRQRATMLRQLVDNGFETVLRENNDFYMVNSLTNQRFKLDGMADAQIARNQIKQAVDGKAHKAASSPLNDLNDPSKEQIEAGNYKKGDVIDLNGMKIIIENPEGSMRRGVSPEGKAWESKMVHHYGDLVRTLGADGDKIDVFIGPRPDTNKVFVIDQVNPDGSFDESKVMFGFGSEEAARAGYLANYEKGWTGLGAITEMTPADFKTWARSDASTKPLGNLAPKTASAPIAKAAQAAPAEQPAQAEAKAQQGQFATLEEAKAYLSAQRRANGNLSGLPLQMADGSFAVAAKGTPQYAEAELQRDKRDGADKKVKSAGNGETFTIKDGGKQRKLKKVTKADLPKKSSRQRPGDPRPISQDEAAAIEQMAAILGKTVVFYETADDQGRLADGFVNPGAPGVIYVATETTVNPVAIFGHEFYHTLRETNPQAWSAISKVVGKRVKNAKGFRQDYYGKDAANAKGDEALGQDQGGELEELISDLGGNLMMDANFWGDVFAQIQKDSGKESKGIIARLAASIQQMIARVMATINQGGYNANEFVDDIEAIRTEFAKALAGHIQKSGVSKSSMDAEIKKSTIRVNAEQKALDEFAEVDAKYRGTEQWMKAPNGQATQLNERQWIQVRTPSFKTWFGDWEAFAGQQGGVWNDDKGAVSKVVDESGEPLVVYHGTTRGGFSEFNAPSGKGRGNLGIFTTSNLEMAQTYNKRGLAKEVQFKNMDREPIEGGSSNGYYASFVNLRNPQEADFEGASWGGNRHGQYKVVSNEDGEQIYTENGQGYFDSQKDAEALASRHDSASVESADGDHIGASTDDLVSEARSAGNDNDGVIIRSVIDDGGGLSGYAGEPSDVFVALNPNQLKSATQNTGEFGKRTDDMRFSRDRDTVSDIDPDGFNEFTATPEEIAQADAYESANGIHPYLTAGQLQVQVQIPNIRKSVKRAYAEKDLAKGRKNHPILGIPLNQNGTVTLYFATTNDDARRVIRERTLKASPGSNRVYLTNESSADKVAAQPGNISDLGDDIQANVMVHVDPSLLQIDTEHADGRVDFFIPIAEGNAFKGKMSQVKLFNMFAERSEPITREKTLKDIEQGIASAMARIEAMSEADRRKAVRQAKDVLKAEHNVSTLLSENGKLQKTRAGDYDLKHYDGESVASLGLGLASAQQITEKLSSCPQHANCEALCLGDTSGQNLLYGGEGPFRAGPRLSQYLKTEAMVMHPDEFALVLHNEIKLLQSWAQREKGFEIVKDEVTGEKTKVPKQLYQASIRLNVTSDFRPITWEPIIKAMPDVEFYDYTKLDTKSVSKNHHLTYSSDGVAQVIDGVAIGNGTYNWDRMLRQMRNGFNVAMAFSDKNNIPKFLIDGSTGERFQVWDGDNYDARFLDPKPGQEGNLLNKGMIVGLTNKDRTKSGLAIALGRDGETEATKAEWKKLVNDIASDERFLNDKSVPYVLKWIDQQKGRIERKDLVAFADSPAVKHNGFFIDYDKARDGDTAVVADQVRVKESYKAQMPKVFEVAKFSRDRDTDTYNQRVSALKDLISCLKK